MAEDSTIIDIQNLIKVYKQGSLEVIALQDLNLKVNREEILCIMGPSGSGKSTLLNQIGAIDRPTGGKIISCGKEITKLKEKELDSYRTFDVGFLFQDFNLSPVLSAIDNILLPMKIAKKLSHEEQKKHALDLLKRVDLDRRKDHKPHELSGGEKQRIALLSSIANEPRLLIADEPTGELDTVTTEEILKLIKEINKEFGITNIIVTHNPAVSRIADRVLQLRDGRISSVFSLNITEGKETPSFELDSNYVLKHLYPPKSCEKCNSNKIDLQTPQKNPEIFARSSHGLINVQIGFGRCIACNFINWGFQPVQ